MRLCSYGFPATEPFFARSVSQNVRVRVGNESTKGNCLYSFWPIFTFIFMRHWVCVCVVFAVHRVIRNKIILPTAAAAVLDIALMYVRIQIGHWCRLNILMDGPSANGTVLSTAWTGHTFSGWLSSVALAILSYWFCRVLWLLHTLNAQVINEFIVRHLYKHKNGSALFLVLLAFDLLRQFLARWAEHVVRTWFVWFVTYWTLRRIAATATGGISQAIGIYLRISTLSNDNSNSTSFCTTKYLINLRTNVNVPRNEVITYYGTLTWWMRGSCDGLCSSLAMPMPFIIVSLLATTQ